MAVRKTRLTGYQATMKARLQKSLETKGATGKLDDKEQAALSRVRWEQENDTVIGTDDYKARNAPDYTKSKPTSADEKIKDEEFLKNMRSIGESYQKRMKPGRKK